MFIDELILNALKEDMPLGDITTDNTVKTGTKARELTHSVKAANISMRFV